MLTWLTPGVILVFSVLATGGAVAFGVFAFRADRNAAPRDQWTVSKRTKPISQSDRLRETLVREIERRRARSRTYAGGALWLAASAYAASAALTGAALVTWSLFGTVLAVLGIATVLRAEANDRRWKSERALRIVQVDQILANALRPDRQPLDVDQQLAEWSDNSDLRVFVMHKIQGPTTTTYQGQLVFETNGVGGWTLRAYDWDLGAADSASVFRGVALNLHHFSERAWRPGNGTFGAGCCFFRRAFVAQRFPDGTINGMDGIVETLEIRVDDPFDTMPFINSGMGQTRPPGPPART